MDIATHVIGLGETTTGLAKLTEVANEYVNDLIATLPALLTAIIVFALFWVGAAIARSVVTNLSEQITDNASLKRLFGNLARIAILAIGTFTAAGILFPGLNAGDLVAVLGLSSVAIGFAFKDIFENFLAGVLILIQRPFHIEDQIIACGYEGIVEDIKIRSTMIKTFDGERIIIPNSDIYSSAVQVRTAFEKRRTTFATGIGYGEDIEQGRETILGALADCEHILQDPEPQVIVSGHGDSSVNFDVRFWTDSKKGNVVAAKNEVATKVKYALDQADIEIPYPYRTVEFFDMTEESAEAGDKSAA